MLSRIFDMVLFRQAIPTIRTGRRRPLVPEDAPPLPDDLAPRRASERYETLNPASFWSFIFGVFWSTGTPARTITALILFRVGVNLATPILIKTVLEQLPGVAGAESLPIGLIVLAAVMGLSGMTGAIMLQHVFFNALRGFGIIVNGINRRVVRHALRLRHSSRASMNTGDLVNHLSSDTDAVAESSFFLPEFTYGLLDTISVLILMSVYLGWASLAAVGTLIILSPLTVLVANRYRRLDHKVMETRDERVTLMSQILQGIRVVKYQAWEPSVHAEVAEVRTREIGTRIKIVATDAMSTALFISTTTIVAFSGFGAFVLLGGELTAPLVFACIALFAMLEDPFGMISHLLANLQHARVAAARLEAFFSAGTRDEDERPLSDEGAVVGVRATGVSLRYPGAADNALDHIDLDITPGSSVAIIGRVGSGKSTLVRTLAGLHQVQSGAIEPTGIDAALRPRSSYVPQEAFIMNATVRENILFGGMGNGESGMALSEVLRACALEQDLQQLPGGLETEIGERGVNLSGGQKQRVSLARAAWHQPGIVFLDDPLSAVDPSTEDLLVDRLLFGHWKDITRVVVTHRLAHLRRFDRVIVVERGRVIADGTYDEVRHAVPREAEMAEAPSHHTEPAAAVPASHVSTHEVAHDPAAEVDHEVQGDVVRITADEDRDTGAVGVEVYVAYVKAMIGRNPVLAPLILVGLIATSAMITVLPILQTSWLGYWTDMMAATGPVTMDGIKGLWQVIVDGLGLTLGEPLYAIGIYGLLGTFVLTGWMGERLLWLYRSAAAGRKIHDDALSGVLTAPLRFFDSTPMGRILNRFARDMEGVDDHLAWNWEQSFKSLSQTIGALILILSVLPLVLLVLIPVLAIYYKLQKDYRTAAREAKRLESIARSPRYAHFKELVTGLDVIHGFGRERFFTDSFYEILGNFQRQFWNSILLNRWFSVRIPIISGLVSVATSIGIVLLARDGAISTGVAGVVLTYALSFWWSLNWAVRAFSEVESRMTSVERLMSYGKITPEPSVTHTPALARDAEWPTDGAIEIRNLSVRYAPELPLVLKDVSFSVPARAKVGIIGRTGSGKSTLFQTLFRFVEPASGSIHIDGVDITSIPLQRLRRSIAIIPQDPTLFIGTVRSNLDRFNECTDDEVWTALRRVRLDDHIRSLPNGLQAVVTEGGLNFSQGQRQLLCMARAILMDARVIVLDEATASVDLETDALIQRTIREEFADVTVLVIAHRLDTVADADLLIELAEGEVKGERVRG